jgi:periplasmic protein TonB
MKTKSDVFYIADVFALGALVTLAGCTSSPTRHATGEARLSPAFSASGDIQVDAPVAVRKVAPQYPFQMRAAGITAVVDVNCLIDEDGKVLDAIAAKSSDSRFTDAAVDALKKWTFQPALRDGIPVPARVNVPVKFTLSEK